MFARLRVSRARLHLVQSAPKFHFANATVRFLARGLASRPFNLRGLLLPLVPSHAAPEEEHAEDAGRSSER